MNYTDGGKLSAPVGRQHSTWGSIRRAELVDTTAQRPPPLAEFISAPIKLYDVNFSVTDYKIICVIYARHIKPDIPPQSTLPKCFYTDGNMEVCSPSGIIYFVATRDIHQSHGHPRLGPR